MDSNNACYCFGEIIYAIDEIKRISEQEGWEVSRIKQLDEIKQLFLTKKQVDELQSGQIKSPEKSPFYSSRRYTLLTKVGNCDTGLTPDWLLALEDYAERDEHTMFFQSLDDLIEDLTGAALNYAKAACNTKQR